MKNTKVTYHFEPKKSTLVSAEKMGNGKVVVSFSQNYNVLKGRM